MSNAEDRRAFPRANIAVEITLHTDKELQQVHAPDIGSGGLRLVVPGDFEKGSELDLHLRLPGDTAPTRVLVRVAWTAEDDLLGLEFVEIPAELRERIDALVWEEIDLS